MISIFLQIEAATRDIKLLAQNSGSLMRPSRCPNLGRKNVLIFPYCMRTMSYPNDVTRAACLFITGREGGKGALTHGLYKSITGLGSQLVEDLEHTEQTEICRINKRVLDKDHGKQAVK